MINLSQVTAQPLASLVDCLVQLIPYCYTNQSSILYAQSPFHIIPHDAPPPKKRKKILYISLVQIWDGDTDTQSYKIYPIWG